MRKLGILIVLFLVGVSFGATPVIAFNPKPEPPREILIALEKLNELKVVISGAVDAHPTLFTDTNTLQQANALYNKIDVVIGMVQQDNTCMEAIKKLEMDIAPKINICDTARIRALSWLSDDPELQDVAYEFAGICQGIIEEINMYLAALGKGIVEVEPSTVKIGEPVTINLIFKSYEPYTVTVSTIDFENYWNGELFNSGTIWSNWPGWITGTVPPYQEVIIYSEANTLPVGSWEMRVVFHTSVGDFPASGSWTVLP